MSRVPALRCRGVGKSFGALTVLRDVNLDVAPGARHALIGPNGAGKSTLFKLISGTLPGGKGLIELAGRDVTGLSEVRRCRRGLSQTLQHASLFGSMTALETVALAVQRHTGRIGPLPRRRPEVTASAARLLADVGLSGREAIGVPALSHGERKLVEVALALACRPRLLLLDEPAAGVSPGESARLVGLLRGLPREITILFVEHDLDLVFELADTVSVLHLGEVLVTGTPDEVRGDERVREAYLGTARGRLFVREGEDDQDDEDDERRGGDAAAGA